MNTDKLRKLAERWRKDCRAACFPISGNQMMGRCADELTALLNEAGDGEPRSECDAVIEKELTEDMHFAPANAEHTLSPDCWCRPTLNYRDAVTQHCVWVHKTAREAKQ